MAYADRENTFVSSNIPLLSNLSMLENIALVLQVHEHLSRKQAHQEVYHALNALGLEKIAMLRYEACSDKEIFLVQLIRACIKKDVRIIIEQPFLLLGDEFNLDFVFNALDTLNIACERVLVVDLIHQKNYYQEDRCHIIE